jgi:hypothetical protein
MLCDYGCGALAIKLFGSGRWCCASHTSKCPAMKKKNNVAARSYLDYDWIEIQNAYDTGLSHRDLTDVFRFSSATILHQAVTHGLLVSRSRSSAMVLARDQGKCKLSEIKKSELAESSRSRILARYESGWMPKAGRCKKYKYVSPIAGEVYLDGTWELAVAKWLDEKEYNWRRNTKRFQYVNLKNKLSYYTPDFWVEELGGYLEIKGYETALDRCKWSQFIEPLVVWKRKELKEYGVLP